MCLNHCDGVYLVVFIQWSLVSFQWNLVQFLCLHLHLANDFCFPLSFPLAFALSLSLQNISFCSHYFNAFLKLANKHKRIHINAFERDKRLAVLSPFLSGGKPICLHKNSDLLWSVFAWMDCISKLLRSVSKHPLLEKPILQNSLNPIRTHSQHKN